MKNLLQNANLRSTYSFKIRPITIALKYVLSQFEYTCHFLQFSLLLLKIIYKRGFKNPVMVVEGINIHTSLLQMTKFFSLSNSN